MAFPIPVAPPVTIATLFFNRFCLNIDVTLALMGAAIINSHVTEDYKLVFFVQAKYK